MVKNFFFIKSKLNLRILFLSSASILVSYCRKNYFCVQSHFKTAFVEMALNSCYNNKNCYTSNTELRKKLLNLIYINIRPNCFCVLAWVGIVLLENGKTAWTTTFWWENPNPKWSVWKWFAKLVGRNRLVGKGFLYGEP